MTDRHEARDTSHVVQRLVGYMAGGDAKGNFAIALVLRLASVIALVLIPFFTGQAVNAVAAGDSDDLAAWCIAAIVAGVIFLVVGIVAERLFARLASDGTYKLQCDLSQHLQTLSLTFFDRQPVGELMSRATNDLESVALFFEDAVSRLLRCFW